MLEPRRWLVPGLFLVALIVALLVYLVRAPEIERAIDRGFYFVWKAGPWCFYLGPEPRPLDGCGSADGEPARRADSATIEL